MLFAGEKIGFHIQTNLSCAGGNRRRMQSNGFQFHLEGRTVEFAETEDPTKAPSLATTTSPSVEPTAEPTTVSATTVAPTTSAPTTTFPTTTDAPSKAPTLIDDHGSSSSPCGKGRKRRGRKDGDP